MDADLSVQASKSQADGISAGESSGSSDLSTRHQRGGPAKREIERKNRRGARSDRGSGVSPASEAEETLAEGGDKTRGAARM